ncbi:hypothetical protein [Desulfovibrio sp. Huiquan2017]|uniref:hypothetical protein n=1 Tax=Desulfovibrio sp. Huiquan2017 TaxID=2816861 RepID=UPI001A921689|nr:hypothetical protein [Desulfovibrio sp. Huiquan2017]
MPNERIEQPLFNDGGVTLFDYYRDITMDFTVNHTTIVHIAFIASDRLSGFHPASGLGLVKTSIWLAFEVVPKLKAVPAIYSVGKVARKTCTRKQRSKERCSQDMFHKAKYH